MVVKMGSAKGGAWFGGTVEVIALAITRWNAEYQPARGVSIALCGVIEYVDPVSPRALRAALRRLELGSVTDGRIEALRGEAATAADFEQVAICDRALGRPVRPAGIWPVARKFVRMAQSTARRLCAQRIAETAEETEAAERRRALAEEDRRERRDADAESDR